MVSVAMSTEGSDLLLFPAQLDESDPNILILRRQEDGFLVAAFSAREVTKEGIMEAAKGWSAAHHPATGGRRAGQHDPLMLLEPR